MALSSLFQYRSIIAVSSMDFPFAAGAFAPPIL
jgi:hypothetical protein